MNPRVHLLDYVTFGARCGFTPRRIGLLTTDVRSWVTCKACLRRGGAQ